MYNLRLLVLGRQDAGCSKPMSFAKQNSKLKSGRDAAFQQRKG
jgi:hypothetical protein